MSKMKERGMIFNDAMVRAILEGRKTQTRRPVKNVGADNYLVISKPTKKRNGVYIHVMDAPKHGLCPFGNVGDRIWVRETFNAFWLDNDVIQEIKNGVSLASELCDYKADYSDSSNLAEGWTPSIHMPRWASRILLEITDVRVERLHDMSEADAKAEGASPATYKITPPEAVYRVGFGDIWRGIYGQENWLSNPWVWVIEFKRIQEGNQ
ncbi:morphogenetic protein [Escherichia coli]|nr:putative morphogenetic protein [Escherichia coli]GCF96161.1 morphogenetic protein [Escherichia coli]